MKGLARLIGAAVVALAAGCGDGKMSVYVMGWNTTHKADVPYGMQVAEFTSAFSETGGVVVVRFEPNGVAP